MTSEELQKDFFRSLGLIKCTSLQVAAPRSSRLVRIQTLVERISVVCIILSVILMKQLCAEYQENFLDSVLVFMMSI